MGRMHSRGKGISASALPYKRSAPSWVKTAASEVLKRLSPRLQRRVRGLRRLVSSSVTSMASHLSRVLRAARSSASSRPTDWHRRSLRTFTSLSRRQWQLGSTWRGTGRTRTPNSGSFLLRAGSTASLATTSAPRSSHLPGSTRLARRTLWWLRTVLQAS